MTATTLSPDTTAAVPVRQAVRTIPTARLIKSELRKMFNTRSGCWMLISIGLLSVLATCAVIIFAPDDEVTYESFATALGFPMSVILPMIAILGVTSEWSQRSGLTTFTLVPHRGRVIRAKMVVSIVLGAVSFGVALAIGALGNIVGSGIAGVDTVWDISSSQMATLILANVLNLLIGFMLGVLIRNSPGAIVGYVVYSFVLSSLSLLLANFQHWWEKAQPWLDFNYAQGPLYEGGLTATEWANLGVSGLIWLVVPLAVGLVMVMRSEVK
jgi:ABC-2 type transport system permease protein